ncbi:hypothetical protein F0562_019329 [Nyssa sinensis]|uniref:Uncharacterized protein n=1 Tax=Nyssa sinensis TaxID=561372 RepID=A0A5J4ZCJ3_9ASTE|nr:hypothetical protein F0562_019329 [Nyssa sinensis]
MSSLHSASSYNSEDKDTPECMMAARHKASSAEMPVIAKLSPPPPGSPLQDHFDYSSKFRALNQFGKGNQSGHSDREDVMPKKVISQQNSMKDASLETEVEVSFEYSNTGTSQDSEDMCTEEDQSRVNKGAEPFFAGIRKKNFRDLSISSQNVDQGNTNVAVNGHPISDLLVKKAEKLAGPVHPGQYWYDFRAGFWGVMGGPCRGIIPPFIEEFNYPMPEDCAGGKYCLGKLAPTVERAKRGFGMKIPRAAA